jgi:hypothetical protein
MFNNVNGYFADSAWKLNASGLKLVSYCSPAAATDLMSYFDSVGLYSLSTVAGSNGVAGRPVSSANASKKLLLSPGGLWGLGSNATIMNAFLKGRAAISAKDLTTKTAQANILVKTFEQLTAAQRSSQCAEPV